MSKLATIFSILTAGGVLLAVISGIMWAIAAIRHRETGAKTLLIIGLVIAAVSFAMFLRSYDRDQRRAEAVQSTSTQEEQPQQESTETPAALPEEPSTTPEPEAETPAEEPEPAAQPVNPLISITLDTHPVMNGPKTERIGTWASITTTKEFLQTVTDEQLHEYLSELDADDYNWFNIFFEDGTGLYCMSGMDGTYIEYGTVDPEEGGAVEYIGPAAESIFLYADGKYSTAE